MFWFEPPDQCINWEYCIDDAICDADINLIESYVSTQNLIQAEVRSDSDESIIKSYRRSEVLFLNDSKFLGLYNTLSNNVNILNHNHFKYNISYIEPLQYSVYKEEDNGFYDIHCDSYLRNTSGTIRKITFVILLNNPSDFEGGKLLLHTESTPVELKMKKGDMMLFPSFCPHSVTPVTKGVRKTLVGWVCGPNFV